MNSVATSKDGSLLLLLPEMLAISFYLDDAVRAPGDVMSGRITISRPTRLQLRSILHEQQHTDEEARGRDEEEEQLQLQQQQQRMIQETDEDADMTETDENGRWIGTESSNRPSVDSFNDISRPSPLAASSLLLQPLTRAFPFSLKLQLQGKCVYDPTRLHAPSMIRRFHSSAGSGTAAAASAVSAASPSSRNNAFRMWSTRIGEITLTKEECEHMPRTYAFSSRLPSCVPASFAGVSLKYVYFLQMLGVHQGRKILDAKVPFRVRVGGSVYDDENEGTTAAAALTLPQIIDTPCGLITSLQLALLSPLPLPPSLAASLPSLPPEPASAALPPHSTAASASMALAQVLATSVSLPLFPKHIASAVSGQLPPAHPSASFGSITAQASHSTPQSTFASTTTGVVGSSDVASGSGILPVTISVPTTPATPSRHRSTLSLPPATPAYVASLPLLLDTPLTFNLTKTIRPRTSATVISPPSSSASSIWGALLGLGGGGNARDRDRADSSASASASATISPSSIDNEIQSAHVAKVTLDNRYTRPGDTVRGHIDFSGAQVRCYRIAITLEQVEQVQEEVAPPLPGNSKTKAATATSAASTATAFRRVFWNFHQYTVNTLSTHFTFCVPLDVVANFRTDLISVSWLLRFSFITDVEVHPKHSWAFLPAPSTTKAEPLRWTLPLQVMPHDQQETLRQSVLKTILCTPQPCS